LGGECFADVFLPEWKTMSLIIEIAIGIVLGAVILRNLEGILGWAVAIGCLGVLIFLVLGMVGAFVLLVVWILDQTRPIAAVAGTGFLTAIMILLICFWRIAQRIKKDIDNNRTDTRKNNL
jgi:uncharacterized membrane protein YqjE